ncbi:MAG: hypothetical protein AAB739_05495 [Patescibacteria group bacterium]
MYKTFSKFVSAVVLASLILVPTGAALADGDGPVLTGEFVDCTMKFKWTKIADDVSAEGYAVFLKNTAKEKADWDKKPFALLKKKNNNYDYYNLKGMPVGTYAAKVALYGYNVSGFIFDNYSNEVAVENKSCEVPKPQEPEKPVVVGQSIYLNGAVTENGVELGFGFESKAAKKSVSFQQFKIERWEMNGKYRVADTKTVFYVNADQNSYTDKQVLSGRKYAYRVAAVVQAADKEKVVAFSKSVKFIFVHPASPLVLSAKYDSVSKKIKLSWDGGVKGLAYNGYALYLSRGTSAPESWGDKPVVLLKKGVTEYDAEFNPDISDNYYFRIYQYQTNTGGVNVYHQPGSNVSVIDNT